MVNTHLPRLAAQAVALDTAAGSTDTSLVLDTDQWTTDTNSYPLLVVVDGELIRANGFTAGATVTLTGCERALNSVAKAHAAGTAVDVADPFRLALGRAGHQTGVPVLQGWSTLLFDDFATLGTYDGGALGSNWTSFDSAGNAGFGLRDTSAVEVITDVTATSNSQAARIRATWDGNNITSGILQLTAFPQTYGRYRFRCRATGDASNQMSPVILLFPNDDDFPAKGEIDIWEGIDERVDLDPMKSFLHRANPATGADEQLFLVWEPPAVSFAPAGTDWHTWQVTWLPTEITIEVDDTIVQTITRDTRWIPDNNMKLSIQLDAFSNTALSADVDLLVDWVLAEAPIFANPPGS